MSLTDEIFSALTDTNDNASVAYFISILRSTPLLHQWLHIVAQNPKAVERLNAVIQQTVTPPEHAKTGRTLLAWIAHVDERFLKKDTIDANFNIPIYGGLTSQKIVTLVRQYQAGSIETSAFLLAHAWRKPPRSPFALLNATVQYLQTVFAQDRPNLLHQLARAADFFHGRTPGSISRVQFGHTSWWRLHILYYMLRNPKQAYRIGEFSRYLAAQKINIDPKSIRRFCIRHHIARDERSGRLPPPLHPLDR